MEKSFAVESVEVLGEAGSGKFEALVSVFGNIDHVRDVVMPNAFAKAIADSDPPPVVWSHHWSIPPIGETIDWAEATNGLQIKGNLFVGESDNHQYADMVYAAMKSREGRKPALREFSFSYDIPEGGEKKATREVDGKSVDVQELHTIFPVHEVGPCLKGCNPATQLINAPKSAWQADLETLIKKGVISKEEILAMFADEEDSVRADAYARKRRELLLAFPDH